MIIVFHITFQFSHVARRYVTSKARLRLNLPARSSLFAIERSACIHFIDLTAASAVVRLLFLFGSGAAAS